MQTTDGRVRVVVTGMGAVTPLGNDVETTWQRLIEGCSGVRPITRFDASQLPVKVAANVRDFDPGQYMDPKEARRLSTFIHYGIAAASQAVDQAGLDFRDEDVDRCGVEIGSALGGTELIEEQRLVLEARGPRAVNPTTLPVVLINSAACAVAIRYGLHGPVSAPVAACATGAVAIGEAYRRLAHGEVEVMIAGGTDSVMTPLALTAFARLGATSSRNAPPEKACAPFSAERDGTVVGEGAAVLVLESLEHALGREAPILAEMVGYGLTSDAFHLVAPAPEGKGAAAAMRQALSSDGAAEQLGWICAHGTGTPLNDLAETTAIKRLFGQEAYRIPVSSIKGGLGHMLGAAGAISAVAAVKATQTGIIPPTINYETPDPQCDLDYVPNAARQVNSVAYAMVNAFGFGGQNAALVFKRWPHWNF